MIQATCIQKIYKGQKIIGYHIQDYQGNTQDMTSDQLKQAIKNNQITITNLTLTSDNRLIDTTPTAQQKQQMPKILEEQKIKNMIVKAKLLGFSAREIPTFCSHKCYLISSSETNHTIYIPDGVVNLNAVYNILTFTDHIKELQGTLKVIGGNSLKNAHHMFAYCQAQSLDLSSFNTSNVTSMVSMFNNCKTKSLDLSHFNTSNVDSMGNMFYGCKAQFIDLSSFNTSNVKNMWDFFRFCNAKIKATDQKILKAYENRSNN